MAATRGLPFSSLRPALPVGLGIPAANRIALVLVALSLAGLVLVLVQQTTARPTAPPRTQATQAQAPSAAGDAI